MKKEKDDVLYESSIKLLNQHRSNYLIKISRSLLRTKDREGEGRGGKKKLRSIVVLRIIH